jgi:phenylalanyl-tRNA synthetase beta chain
VVDAFGLDASRRRVAWLAVDLELLLMKAPRRSAVVAPVSRFPSSDHDLDFVVDDAVPAAAVRRTLQRAGGDLLESVVLSDVYREPGARGGFRSLTFRLRFCARDHTLDEPELAEARRRCISAVEEEHGGRLRGG